MNDRSGRQQRCDLVLVWIRDVPAELIVAHATDGFGTRGTRPRGIASDVRIDRFHAHRFTAVVHVRLKRCEKRGPGQPEIPIMPRDLSCRNIEVRGVSHVLRKRDVLWNYVFREHPKAKLNGNRSLFTARIKVKIEIDLRPGLDQTSGVRRKDVSVFPQRVFIKEETDRIGLWLDTTRQNAQQTVDAILSDLDASRVRLPCPAGRPPANGTAL